MNIAAAMMQVDYWKARTSYLEYRELVKSKRATKGDDDLRRAYREISLGRKVIDINLAITNAGVDDQGLPKLAIARADWEFVCCWWAHGRAFFSRTRPGSWRQRDYFARHNVGVRMPRTGTWSGDGEGRAQVPMIPPAHRPTGPLSAYRILFEAVWERRPPVDPLLLRAIGGPFYVVLAHWDLTPLEQAVLRARL